MTKKELIEALEPYPDHMEIFIDATSISGEFPYVPLNGAESEVLAHNEVIVLSE